MKRSVCAHCARPSEVCYCAQIQAINNDWPVIILQEAGEARHALGTARIAALSLQRCALLEIATGRAEQARQTVAEVLARQPVLIYPGEQARPVAELRGDIQRPLLFLDASWRKSRRLLHEHPELAQLPRYQLSEVPVSRYRIRREPGPGFVSTVEAIAAALALLEGDRLKYAAMLHVLEWMIDRQIAFMGAEVFARNYPGSRGES